MVENCMGQFGGYEGDFLQLIGIRTTDGSDLLATIRVDSQDDGKLVTWRLQKLRSRQLARRRYHRRGSQYDRGREQRVRCSPAKRQWRHRGIDHVLAEIVGVARRSLGGPLMMKGNPLIRLQAVKRQFDDGTIIALRNVKLVIATGECLAITGPSGSGKTSLLNMLSGIDMPTKGQLYWNDLPVRSRKEWAALEPTGNLDSVNAAHIIDLLLGLQEDTGMTLVLMTHDENLAARCKRCISIRDGEIIEDRLLVPPLQSAPLDVPK
jgi:ABC-type glutathione transport system ATPase component